MAVSVAFVDDSAELLFLYELDFGDDDRFELVGQAQERGGVIDLTRDTHPDVLCLDLYLDDDDSLSLIKEVKQHAPDTKVIVLSGSVRDDPVLTYALDAGADAYVDKMEWVNLLKPTILTLADDSNEIPETT
jgi:DNA-binding NarL/FixJ family response regulator